MREVFKSLRTGLKATALTLATLSTVMAPVMTAVRPALAAEAQPAAAKARWAHQGVSIMSMKPNDFGSESMRISLQDLKSTGANEVLFVIPLYQQNLKSCTFTTGAQSPTMDALAAGTKMAHDQGLKVILKFHAEVSDQIWRAYIDATDRNCWFNNYGTEEIKYLNGSQGADGAIIGTEQHNMFATSVNPTNAPNVAKLVQRLRANFNGTLAYDSNSAGMSENFDINWNLFDYGGVSCYWNLDDNLAASWNNIAVTVFDRMHAMYPNRTFACTEIGYRSVTNAHRQPWDYTLKGAIDYDEQARDYQALFDFLRSRPYLSGVDFWNWRVDYNAQDVNETEYTPQKKKAQAVMTANFTSQPVKVVINPAPVANSTPAIAARYAMYRGALGLPVGGEAQLGGGAVVQGYQYGRIYYSPATGAQAVYGAILGKYLQMGGPAAYGLPVTSEANTPGAAGRYNQFQYGRAIYWSPATGAQAVYGAILQKYLQMGGPAGYGFPVTDETSTPDRVGRYNHFQYGHSIYWTPYTGAHAIYGAIRARWAALGWERSYLGYPTTDEYDISGGRANNFQHGYITWNARTGYVANR